SSWLAIKGSTDLLMAVIVFMSVILIPQGFLMLSQGVDKYSSYSGSHYTNNYSAFTRGCAACCFACKREMINLPW
ncbi:MAG: hypothetical protein ACI9J5_000316, partial [Paraglaciecola sp.]